MKHIILISFLLYCAVLSSVAQIKETSSFKWGNVTYFNMDLGDTIVYNEIVVKLLKVKNCHSVIQVGADTVSLELSRRSLPVHISGLKIFVAGNKFLKDVAANPEVFGLVKKEVLLAVANELLPLTDRNSFFFSGKL